MPLASRYENRDDTWLKFTHENALPRVLDGSLIAKRSYISFDVDSENKGEKD
jgi:hypothetical protein